jgi:hypothetical protein
MTSVINSVTSWLGGSRDRDSSPEGEKDTPTATTPAPADATESAGGATDDTKDAKSALPIDVDLHEVSEKAISAAKELGSYLFTFGKTATEQVAKTAKQIKDSVEEKTIIGDFTREQDKFLAENRDKKKQSEAAVPPWVGYNEEEIMKSQILALSKDKRNFLRNPPAGVQFHFDYEASFPIALVMLDEDPDLKAMRFKIVPREIKEEVFWRNYFYRVSLIKQSTQLTSLAQHPGPKADVKRSTAVKSESKTSGADAEADELPVGSPLTDHEFVSDTFQTGDINAEELKKEMDQLGVSDKKDSLAKKKRGTGDDVPEWERELQAELQEYEVVDDGNNIDDADLERELMNQIEAESKET